MFIIGSTVLCIHETKTKKGSKLDNQRVQEKQLEGSQNERIPQQKRPRQEASDSLAREAHPLGSAGFLELLQPLRRRRRIEGSKDG